MHCASGVNNILFVLNISLKNWVLFCFHTFRERKYSGEYINKKKSDSPKEKIMSFDV
jgi:hypothetical protein